MRADEHVIKDQALTGKRLQDKPVRQIKIGLREAVCAQAVLVRDHGKAITRTLQLLQRGKHAGHEADLGQTIDLLIEGFFDQRAIAVYQQQFDRGIHFKACSRMSFCSGVPTEMRSACGSSA